MKLEALLLDTCAVIWLVEGSDLAEAAVGAIDAAFDNGTPLNISPVTAWEIGVLAARGRFKSPLSPQCWFQRLLDLPGIRLADMPPEVLIGSSLLPGNPPRDPADRIIAATVREYGYTLVTRDRTLLDYGGDGHMIVLPC